MINDTFLILWKYYTFIMKENHDKDSSNSSSSAYGSAVYTI